MSDERPVRVCPSADVTRVAEMLRELHAMGVLPGDALGEFLVRDDHGVWWTPEASSASWWRFQCEDRGWAASAEEPSGPLLGPTAVLPPRPFEDDGVFELPPVIDGDARDSIEGLVRDAREAFREGRLDSRATAELVMEYILLDRGGRAWTVGFASDEWYAFTDGDWVRQGARPELDVLLDPGERPRFCARCGARLELVRPACPACDHEAAGLLPGLTADTYAGIQSFLETGIGTLPEPVVDGWDPPSDPPPAPGTG